MFRILFSLNQETDSVSGFDLGNIEIISDNIIISSKYRNPDQSMMIFQTIVNILDGLKLFFIDKKIKNSKVNCADSSFDIVFSRRSDSKIDISIGKEVIEKLDENELIKQVYDSCYSFFVRYKDKMPENDPFIDDVEVSLNDYRNYVLILVI